MGKHGPSLFQICSRKARAEGIVGLDGLRHGPAQASDANQGGIMSRQLSNAYRAELDHLKAVSGSKRESVLREAFKDLLKRWGKSNDLLFIPEHDLITAKGNRIYVDGALLHGLRVPFGY